MRALILIGVLSLLVISCSPSRLPSIKNPDLLREDCAKLFKNFAPDNSKTNSPSHLRLPFYGEREIPKEKWPASVQALHPLKVSRDKYAICIWILQNTMEKGKNWQIKGYYVHENPNLSPPRFAHGGGGEFDLEYTKYKDIDICYLPIAVL